MGTGLGISLSSFSPGTTIQSGQVNSNFSAINAAAIANDSVVTTDGSGHITAGNGRLTNVTMLSPAYHLTTNPTVSSGNTTTLTCTGGSTGVPSGATAVLLGIGLFSVNVQGGYVQIAPHGGTIGNYVNFTAAGPVNTYCAGFVIVPLSGGGQIDVRSNAANIVLQDWYIIGYVN